ncbi:MSHA biogenesis protein MshQ, partial [Vibrio anguillarum]|nr:MSHA biogenesis protein MshQ [Vibrio anguillarum]
MPSNNGYRIKNFQLNQNSKVILTNGDYWFESANFVQNSQLVIDGDVRIFILGNTEISGSQLNTASTGNLTIVAYGDISLNNQSIVNGYIYAANQLTLNNNSELNGRVTARQLTMSGSSRINQFEQQLYACFSDNFNRSSLGQNWIPYTSTGGFTPSLISNRLRLTEDQNNQATAVT